MQHIFLNVTGVVELVVTACTKGVCVYSGYLKYDKVHKNTFTDMSSSRFTQKCSGWQQKRPNHKMNKCIYLTFIHWGHEWPLFESLFKPINQLDFILFVYQICVLCVLHLFFFFFGEWIKNPSARRWRESSVNITVQCNSGQYSWHPDSPLAPVETGCCWLWCKIKTKFEPRTQYVPYTIK